MKDLIGVFEEAGCREVRTHLQSGNVLFRATPARARKLPELISRGISTRFDLAVPVVLRTGSELVSVVKGNPYLKTAADIDKLHVAFLATRPGKAEVAGLDPDRSPPDEFQVRGSEIYLHCPAGLARTKLSNDYFDRRLNTISTVRTWKTVLKLMELTGS